MAAGTGTHGKVYRFGVFEFAPDEGELTKAGRKVSLPPQPAKVLTLLLERRGEVVTRDELRQAIWADGTTVDFEQGLNFCIKRLRGALGDDAASPRFIETLPRRGYRFLPPVEAVGRSGAEAIAVPARRRLNLRAIAAMLLLIAATIASVRLLDRREPPRVMIAVLPFDSREVGDRAYLGDGVMDELIAYLGRFDPQHVGVIARTSTIALSQKQRTAREIGDELSVQYVIDGTVKREGDSVRITARMIRTADHAQVWSRDYERASDSAPALARDVARAIAEDIRASLGPPLKHRRPHPDAYVLYLQGRFFWNKRTEEAFNQAIELFTRAIQLDPDYAEAHAGLADAYALLGSGGNNTMSRADAMTKARLAAERSLQLDDTLAEPHGSLAFVKMHFDWDWAGAGREFQRAIALNPSYATAHHWYAYYLIAMNRPEEALVEIHTAHRYDPLSVIIARDVGEISYFAGRYDDAVKYCRQALAMDPTFNGARQPLAWALEKLGRNAEAVVEHELAGNRAEAALIAGRREEALRLLEEEVAAIRSARFEDPAHLAAVYAFFNQPEKSLEWLERAYQIRAGSFIVLNFERPYESVRNDPRFRALMRRVGL